MEEKLFLDDSLGANRSERRSFFCPNNLWEELEIITKEKSSISKYIREAIKEKMERDYKSSK